MHFSRNNTNDNDDDDDDDNNKIIHLTRTSHTPHTPAIWMTCSKKTIVLLFFCVTLYLFGRNENETETNDEKKFLLYNLKIFLLPAHL